MDNSASAFSEGVIAAPDASTAASLRRAASPAACDDELVPDDACDTASLAPTEDTSAGLQQSFTAQIHSGTGAPRSVQDSVTTSALNPLSSPTESPGESDDDADCDEDDASAAAPTLCSAATAAYNPMVTPATSEAGSERSGISSKASMLAAHHRRRFGLSTVHEVAKAPPEYMHRPDSSPAGASVCSDAVSPDDGGQTEAQASAEAPETTSKADEQRTGEEGSSSPDDSDGGSARDLTSGEACLAALEARLQESRTRKSDLTDYLVALKDRKDEV